MIDALAAASPQARTTTQHTRGAAPVPVDPDAKKDAASPTEQSGISATSNPNEANALHERILSRIGGADIPEDMLIREVGGDAEQVAGEILTLELSGRIARKSGGVLSLA